MNSIFQNVAVFIGITNVASCVTRVIFKKKNRK